MFFVFAQRIPFILFLIIMSYEIRITPHCNGVRHTFAINVVSSTLLKESDNHFGKP